MKERHMKRHTEAHVRRLCPPRYIPHTFSNGYLTPTDLIYEKCIWILACKCSGRTEISLDKNTEGECQTFKQDDLTWRLWCFADVESECSDVREDGVSFQACQSGEGKIGWRVVSTSLIYLSMVWVSLWCSTWEFHTYTMVYNTLPKIRLGPSIFV